MPQNARSQPNALERRLSRLSMIGSKSIIVKDHIRASLMKHRSDSIFSVTDSRVMIHSESSLLRHSLCNSFSLYLSHFWGHIMSLPLTRLYAGIVSLTASFTFLMSFGVIISSGLSPFVLFFTQKTFYMELSPFSFALFLSSLIYWIRCLYYRC